LHFPGFIEQNIFVIGEVDIVGERRLVLDSNLVGLMVVGEEEGKFHGTLDGAARVKYFSAFLPVSSAPGVVRVANDDGTIIEIVLRRRVVENPVGFFTYRCFSLFDTFAKHLGELLEGRVRLCRNSRSFAIILRLLPS